MNVKSKSGQPTTQTPTQARVRSKYRVFRADGTRPSRHLDEADELVNYDGVELCPVFHAYFDGCPEIAPGSIYDLREVQWAHQWGQELRRRTAELPPFFDAGGLLVLWARGPSQLRYVRTAVFAGDVLQLDSHDWLEQMLLGPGAVIKFNVPLPDRLFTGGGGDQVRVLEPGHAFADYLDSGLRYETRVHPLVENVDNAIVLAVNRGNQPVAAEFKVGKGSVVVVPPPVGEPSRALLATAIEETLDARLGLGEVLLAEETTLEQDRVDLERAHRAARDGLFQRRAALAQRKARALADTNVRRVVEYWVKITRTGTTRDDALKDLYKLIEIITGLYHGEDAAAATLGVPLSTIKDPKRLANQHELDVRHARPGETVAIPDADYANVMAKGRTLVVAFVEKHVRETRPPP